MYFGKILWMVLVVGGWIGEITCGGHDVSGASQVAASLVPQHRVYIEGDILFFRIRAPLTIYQ